MYTADHRTVSFSLPWDSAPIDLSWIFKSESPAGKHGFLTANGSEFTFEDGTPARFWGTNFNSGACFPTHEYSELVAKRLAMFGMNLVRFHQLDGDWSTPNIFQFSRGNRINDTRSLDPESMERLDYLIYALKKNGIYVYLDNITYRRFRSADGVENAPALADGGSPQVAFDPRLIELQKEFMSQLWNHVNPYTKLAYKDDPAIVMTEIANENDLFTYSDRLVEPYRTRLEERYVAWRKKKGLPDVALPVNFADKWDVEIARFKLEIMQAFFEEMRNYLRSIGLRIPITGTNWIAGCLPLNQSQENMDFMDGHIYHYGWAWKPHLHQIANESMLDSDWLLLLSTARFADRPFFVSEWDEPWPNQYRAEGPLYLAAICGFQNWAGTAIHTYRYDCRPNIDMIAAPVTGEALSGVPYRSGIFDAFNDPCRFGLFYHAALMFRRGDISQSPRTTVIPCPDVNTWSWDGLRTNRCARFEATHFAYDLTTTAMALPSTRIPEGAKVVDRDVPLVDPDAEVLCSDTGELRRDRKHRRFTIDTARSKAAIGFLGSTEEIRLNGLTIRCRNRFAVIALTSLDGKPLSESENIFLAAVGNADNTGATYNDDHTVQFDKGHGPIEAEVIVAEIELATSVPSLRIDAVNTMGMQVGRTEATQEDGVLKFTIGGDFPSIYYLIQRI